AFRKAAAADPEEGMFHFYLGDALQETGDHAAALASLEKAIELMPEHSGSRYYAGLSHHRLGDDQAAVKRYREALAIDTSDPYLHYHYGVSLRALGLEDEARKQFAIASAENPELADPAAADPPAAGNDPPMAENDAPAPAAEFRPIRSFKEVAGEWYADFTVSGTNNFRMQDTTHIDEQGNLSSSRIIYTYDANGNEYTQRQTDQSRMYLDGNQLLLGKQGQPFTRHNYKYNGKEFHIEYKELGGTVIWHRQ
ncbi:tetratricopeptide repeat protein, partial [Alienimonas sp. DA493]|uniref:tetratricopeptide repeat protein n=1 Tax=Alienimonas sp. DA493 TaxID=3373605 RepID=UPI00375488BE